MDGRPYLLEVLRTLWPREHGPQVHRGSPGPHAEQMFIAFPNGRSPNLLLPCRPRAAAAALRAYGGHGSRASRLRSRLAAGLMASGLGGRIFRDRVSVVGPGEGISDEIERVLGFPVQVALRGGPPRANRKPVLAVMDDDSRPVAFVKVGVGPLTDRLVRTENDALLRMAEAGTGTVRVPRVLHFGRWRDLFVLVEEALPVQASRSLDAPTLQRAMKEVAEAFGTTSMVWSASDHARSVRERLQVLPRRDLAGRLGSAADVLAAEEVPLPIGAWHGDWTPWNCASVDGCVLLWDWERFDVGVPLGFDLLHFDLQTSLRRAGTPSSEQPHALLATAATRLQVFGLTPEQARATALAYLLELASRYLVDDQAGAGARAGDVEHWLLPVITEAVQQVSPGGGRSR